MSENNNSKNEKNELRIVKEVYDIRSSNLKKMPKGKREAINPRNKVRSATTGPCTRAAAKAYYPRASPKASVKPRRRIPAKRGPEEMPDTHYGPADLRPTSFWYEADGLHLKSTVIRMIHQIGHHRSLSEMKDQWRGHRTITDVNANDANGNADDDDDFDDNRLAPVDRVLTTQHPQVFNYFKNLGRLEPKLAMRIVEACLTGVKETATEKNDWHFF